MVLRGGTGTITAAMEVHAVARLSGYAFLRSCASVNEPHANSTVRIASTFAANGSKAGLSPKEMEVTIIYLPSISLSILYTAEFGEKEVELITELATGNCSFRRSQVLRTVKAQHPDNLSTPKDFSNRIAKAIFVAKSKESIYFGRLSSMQSR